MRVAHHRVIRLVREAECRELADRCQHGEEGCAADVPLAQQAAVDQLEERTEQVDGQGSPAATASTASKLKSPVKTPRRTNRARANGLSRSMLHSTVAWIVRWRSGASRPDVTRRESTRSSFTSMADGVRTRMHAAASSIASGTPSSARQMRATSAAFSAVRSNLESAACARSRNSRTAGASAISASDTSRGSIGRASGSTSKTCSACTRSLARLVTMTVASGSAASSDATSGAAPITCSKLSTTRRSLRPLRASASRSRVGTPMSSCTPSSRATAGSTPAGSRTCSRATNVTRSNRSRASRCGLDRETGLPDPARADEGDEPVGVVAAQPLEQRAEVGLASEHLVGRRREMVGRVVRAGVRGVGRSAPGARGVEALREQDREVRFDELSELLGRRERLVRGRVVVADVRDELGESLLAFRRLLHVDELRHLVRRESVLVLEAGHLLAGGDPAVLLPVHADEHVALLEIGAVHLPRGVRPSSELEHDGGQVQPLDRGARGDTFGLELLEGRADEDPQSLVGGADDARLRGARHRDGTFHHRVHPRRRPMVPIIRSGTPVVQHPDRGSAGDGGTHAHGTEREPQRGAARHRATALPGRLEHRRTL